MDFKTYIYQRLKELRNEMTQQEMAKKAGCAQSYINHILNNPADCLANVRLDILLRLCPELFSNIIQNGQVENGIGISNGNNATVNTTIHSSTFAREKLSSAVLDDDSICDACKVKILKLLKSVE
ncbi:MAG: helix-turn-helix transcriptional regulator [Victivallales bacterium]|nr:helix-turn-helix transcriptional regulator [Victivallales bacterium]